MVRIITMMMMMKVVKKKTLMRKDTKKKWRQNYRQFIQIIFKFHHLQNQLNKNGYKWVLLKGFIRVIVYAQINNKCKINKRLYYHNQVNSNCIEQAKILLCFFMDFEKYSQFSVTLIYLMSQLILELLIYP